MHDPKPGVIDAHQFTAPDGKHYLIWEVDGGAIGAPTPIRIQPLADDGVTLTGAPKTILTNDRSWEGGLVEGPWIREHGGSYYLFYRATGYTSTAYAIGVARAASPLGPFTKASGPILTSNAWWSGPGMARSCKGRVGTTCTCTTPGWPARSAPRPGAACWSIA